jgi:serine/threonine-protein kinase HipA
MALPDEHAAQHWLVKLPRGHTSDDRLVLRNEAAYLRVAQRCGLRVHGDPELHGEKLFVRRFDRHLAQRIVGRLAAPRG